MAVHAPRGGLASARGLKVTNDAGAPTILVRFDGDFTALAALREDPLQAAHHLRTGGHTLVIGAGGGRDVLAAMAAGQDRVTAVEINPVMGELVTEHFADFVGRIFEDPRVRLHIQEGRNFVAASEDLYDVIQFTMIDSWGGAAAAGAYVFSENSLYTIEAVDDYVRHLAPGGILSMTRFYQWDEALRLTNLFAEYLESKGLRDVEQRIVAIKKRSGGARPVVTVLLKNGRFTAAEVAALGEFSESAGSTIVHAPHLEEAAFETTRADQRFRSVVAPGRFGTTREAIVRANARDISAPTDDRPFFFFSKRFGDALRLDPHEHAARRVAIPLLYGMLAVFGAIALLVIFLPLYLRSRREIREAPMRRRTLLYFAMLGTGFMLIEISLIQRLTIFLGHPTWSFVVVLATLLFASGLGSLYSARWPNPSPAVLARVLAGIALLVGLYAVAVYDQLIDWMWLGRTSRIALAVAVIAPAGFLMGMCFPLGVQIARRLHETLVPWGWGVNGAFSVFASALSIALAIAVGFKATLAVGVACYLVALLIIASMVGPGRIPEARPSS